LGKKKESRGMVKKERLFRGMHRKDDKPYTIDFKKHSRELLEKPTRDEKTSEHDTSKRPHHQKGETPELRLEGIGKDKNNAQDQ